MKGKFNWQEGYAVFSYSHSHIDRVVKYVLNQEQHHKKKTFREEYHELLKKFEIPFEENICLNFLIRICRRLRRSLNNGGLICYKQGAPTEQNPNIINHFL